MTKRRKRQPKGKLVLWHLKGKLSSGVSPLAMATAIVHQLGPDPEAPELSFRQAKFDYERECIGL